MYLKHTHLRILHSHCNVCRVENGISFRKIPRNRLGTVFVIPRKKVLIPRHSKVHGRVNSEARNETERKYAEKNSFRNGQNNLTKWFARASSNASIFVPMYRNPSIFHFRGMIRNGIPRFRLPWNNFCYESFYKTFFLVYVYFNLWNRLRLSCPRAVHEKWQSPEFSPPAANIQSCELWAVGWW